MKALIIITVILILDRFHASWVSFNNASCCLNVFDLVSLLNNSITIIIKALLNFPFKKQFFLLIDSTEVVISGAQDVIEAETNLLPYVIGGTALILAGAGVYALICYD
jgi:hypothetical protein